MEEERGGRESREGDAASTGTDIEARGEILELASCRRG
jgi:hypothetical protein